MRFTPSMCLRCSVRSQCSCIHHSKSAVEEELFRNHRNICTKLSAVPGVVDAFSCKRGNTTTGDLQMHEAIIRESLAFVWPVVLLVTRMDINDRRRLSPDEKNFKRRMKTPVQLEALERVYAEDRYPAEAVRAELSSQLNLSDKQLQMWFCHRRLKDRKGKDEDSPNTNVARKKPRTDKHGVSQYPGVVLASEASDPAVLATEHYGDEYLYEGQERFTPEERKPRARKSGAREGAFPGKRRSQALAARAAEAELAAIAAVEAQLGEPLREDGPPLGLEFDPLPPGAFSTNEDAPAEPRSNMEHTHFASERGYEYPEQQKSSRAALPTPPLSLPHIHNSGGSKRKFMHNSGGPPPTLPVQYERPPVREYQFLPEQPERLEENQFYERATTQLTLFPGPDRHLELLHQSRMEEMRLKEAEAQEKRMRKDAERQEALRRKREEQMRKEQERLEEKRKKEEERARKDRLKEQERIEKELKREAERQEKESKKMEKQRRREEARKEKLAAKLKAANERALAKRLAKEMTDLMDDEQLERMEAAAAVSAFNLRFMGGFGKPAVVDASQITLKPFPPTNVRMRPVVSIQPWSNSDQNVGNLLMVWKFLITFADVIGIWPFTLDELVQAFHDYDSRLLGELHVALIRTMVKDIEDAAQAVSGGMVGQRDAIAMAAGGHPQLVEAAFSWGFDIRDWGKHVNAVTWPEILRQFSLAAGFGPKWKKRKPVSDRAKDAPEKEDGEDVVANLRSGAAAASAVASMQGRGMGHLRRSQYRLTPGTVKYAAFHVLSLEGDKGLNIFEVADRIQSSGLRDLSTSRTPEASIAAALSRDTVLFERTAPSTYCVRTQFRKDPEDAEEILSAAREKIRLFRSGFLDGEEADKEGDDVDREEYESEGQDVEDVEDMEDEDLEEDHVPASTEKKVIVKIKDVKGETDSKQNKSPVTSVQRSLKGCKEIDNGILKSSSARAPVKREDDGDEEEDEEDDDDLVKEEALQSEDHKIEIQLGEDTEIDESQVGEPWVQGLVEGEYSDLSVEERLSALVALLTVVNEGNAIRVALEERLEAATALKRQMWAEMQLEKRRHKEEQLNRSQFFLLPGSVKPDGESPDAENMAAGTLSLYDQGRIDMNVPNTEGSGLGDTSAGKSHNGLSNGQFTQEAGPSVSTAPGSHVAEKSRAQAKADIGLRAEELYVFRSLPLGSDRRHNRYWQFITGSGGQDPGCGRLFFESNSDGHWAIIDTEEAFDALLASLDARGAREAALTAILHRLEGSLRRGMRMNSGNGHISLSQSKELVVSQNQVVIRGLAMKGTDESPVSSISGSETEATDLVGAISVELGRTAIEQKQAFERYRDVEKWIWSDCLSGASALKSRRVGQKREGRLYVSCEVCHDFYAVKDKHCQCCHATFESSSPRLHLKFAEHSRECEDKRKKGDPNWKSRSPVAAMPSRLQMLKSDIFTMEIAIPSKALKKEWSGEPRKAWGASLKTATEPSQVLQALTALEDMIERDWLSSTYETTEEITSTTAGEDHQSSEPVWIPPTTAAVALRIRLLDDALAYSEEAKVEREKQEIEDEINQKHTKIPAFRFTPEGIPGDQDDEQPGEMLEVTGSMSGKGKSRVRSSGGGRARGGRGAAQGGQGGQSGQTAQGGGRRRSTAGPGAGSRSRVRSSNAAVKKGSKRRLQFQEGAAEVAQGDSKQVWGGAARGRSVRSVAGRGGKAARRGGRVRAGPRPVVHRAQIGSRRPGQKQRNPNELMVSSGHTPSKKSKAVGTALAKQDVEEDEDMEDESNGGDSQTGYAEEGYEDADQYDGDNNDDADEQNGSDVGEGADEEEEEEMDDEPAEEEDEEGEGEGEGEDVDEEGEEGEEGDEGEEDLDDDDGDGQEEDDGYDKEEGPEGDEYGHEREGRNSYGKDGDDAEEEEEEEDEEEEGGGDETEDDEDNEDDKERRSYSDED